MEASLLVPAVCATLTAAFAFGAARIVPWRVRHQPVPVDVDAEQAILVHTTGPVLEHVRDAVSVDWFTDASRRDAWRILAGDDTGTAIDDEQRCATALEHIGESNPALQQAVITVGVCAEDRGHFQGSARLVETGQPARPLTWQPAAASWKRALFSSGVAGVAAVSTAPFVYGAVGWIGLAALAAWLVTGVLLAWVDVDTLFIDLPTVVAGYGAAGLLAAYASWTAYGSQAVWRGVFALAACALFFLFVTIYSRLRGIAGMGGGDFIILPALCAIPMWLGSDTMTLVWGILASAVFAVATWAVTSRGRSNRTKVPFPFGPGLIVGFAAAFATYAAFTTVNG